MGGGGYIQDSSHANPRCKYVVHMTYCRLILVVRSVHRIYETFFTYSTGLAIFFAYNAVKDSNRHLYLVMSQLKEIESLHACVFNCT